MDFPFSQLGPTMSQPSQEPEEDTGAGSGASGASGAGAVRGGAAGGASAGRLPGGDTEIARKIWENTCVIMCMYIYIYV